MMKYYFVIKDEKIFAKTRARINNALNIEVNQYIYENSEKYIYKDGEIVLDPDYEQKQKEKEQEEIDKLNMTRGDFFEGLIIAQGKDEEDVIALIDKLELYDITKKIYKNRVKNALDFYRSYPLVDVLGERLGLTKEQMDMFFKTKNYNYLKPVEEVVNE